MAIDRERYEEILQHDMESFFESVNNMTKEDAEKIKEYDKYGFHANYHSENITLRSNQILSAIGYHKEDPDFILKAGTLRIIFFDKTWYETVEDMNSEQIAGAFHTTTDNVIMFDALNKKMKTFEKNEEKVLKKS